MSRLTSASKTDVGMVRKMNQDSVISLSGEEFNDRIEGLYIVADGMGGKAGGEIASRITIETVPAVVHEALDHLANPLDLAQIQQILMEGIEAANESVFTQARASRELRGMGTTCVAALFYKGQALIANVGDSRCYLLRAGKMLQVTADHSLVMEHVRMGELTLQDARESRYRNVITRAVGIAGTVEPEFFPVLLEEGDLLLLCSDGLSTMVEDEIIAKIAFSTHDLSAACNSLIESAKSAGGDDNISVILVQFGERAAVAPTRESERQVQIPVGTDRYSPSETARKGAVHSSTSVFPWLLCCVLSAALAFCLSGGYIWQSKWPFYSLKPAEKVMLPAPTVRPPDLRNLNYEPAVRLSTKDVANSPLVSDGQGNVYAVALKSGTPVRFDKDGKFTALVNLDAAPGSQTVSRSWAMDPQGNLYVSDKVHSKILKFDSAGTRIASIEDKSIKAPEALAVDTQGTIYVVDSHKIFVIRPKLGVDLLHVNGQR